jgi:predicted nuclease with TOPRIM domain
LNYQGYQRNAIADLREKLDKLNDLAAKEPPESPRLNKAFRKVLDEYAGFADKTPEDLTPEVQAWLREVEQFRDTHAKALNPKASRDERVNARLAEIGPYEVSYDRETPSVVWEDPAGLACEWTDFRLRFELVLEKKPEPSRVAASLDALCDEFGRLRERWPELCPGLERHIVELFRRVISDNIDPDEREAYEDDDGELSDEKILEAVEGGVMVLTRHFEEPVHTEIYFSVSWDEEHGIEVQLDENGEILSWF